MRIALLLVACLLSLTIATSGQAAIIVSYGYSYAGVNTNKQSADNYQFSTTGGTASASLPIPASAQTVSSFGPSGFFATFTHQRSSGNAAAQGYSYAEFTVTDPTPYYFSGSYTNDNGLTYIQANLYDATVNTDVFYEYHGHQSSAPVTLSIGNSSGNLYNQVVGSSSGMLTPGHLYLYQSLAYTYDSFGFFGGTGDSSAAGSFSLTTSTSVPEPASLAAWSGIALVGAIGGFLRKRRTSSSPT